MERGLADLIKNLSMAIIVRTNDPNLVLDQLYSSIDEGLIDAWSYDGDKDFSCVGQWEGKGWFRPVIEAEQSAIKLIIVGRNIIPMTRMEYSVFHGSFLKCILNQVSVSIIDEIVVTKPGSDIDESKTVEINWK